MAPLPANTTGRVFVVYTANGHEHRVQFRYEGGGPPTASFLEEIDDFLITLNPLMPTNWTFVSWGYIESAGDFLVALPGSPTAFAGTGTAAPWKAPAYVSFIGSGAGRRVRIYLLGANLTPDQAANANDYRVTSTENGTIASAIAALTAGSFQTIGSVEAVWKNYANLGFNRHWQDDVRT